MDQEGGPSLGVVTECISSVDAQVLQIWRPELARLSADTGLQIFETQGLSGSNVMVIGPKAILKNVVPVLAEALRGNNGSSCFAEIKNAMRASAGVAPPGLLSPPPGLRFLIESSGLEEVAAELSEPASDQASFACLDSSLHDCEGKHINSLATSDSVPRARKECGSSFDLLAEQDDGVEIVQPARDAADTSLGTEMENEDEQEFMLPEFELEENDPTGSPKFFRGARLDKSLPFGPESPFSIHSRMASKEKAPSALLSNAFSALSEATASYQDQEPAPSMSATMFQANCGLARLSPTMSVEATLDEVCAEPQQVDENTKDTSDSPEASNPFGVSDMLSSAISAVLADASTSDAPNPKKKKSKSEKKKQAQQQANASETFQFSFPKPVALEGVKSRKKIIFRMNQAGFTYPGNKKATVSDVSLEVSQVSRIVVTGAKGAGKSTVMKMMIWEQLPTTGTIQKVEGLQVAHLNKDSFTQLEKHMDETPLEYIMRHAARANPQDSEGEADLCQDEIDRHLLNFGLEPKSITDRLVKQLGEAEKVKVALAASLWRRPHVLILDEPATYLGSEALEAVLLAIKEYKGGVVLFTHTKDKDCFDSLGGEVWNIRGGQLRIDSRSTDADVPKTPLRKGSGGTSRNDECKSSDKKNVVAKDLKDAIQDVERKLKNNTLTEEEGWDIKLKLDELKQMMS